MKAEAGERAQASVEVAAGTAGMVVAALLALHLLAAGYAAVMADHAAEAGALALADGGGPDEAARSAVPAWPDRAIRVEVNGGRVLVTLVPPSPLAFLRERLSASGRAVVRRPARGQVAGRSRWAL